MALYSHGCRPDPHDPRDRPLGALLPSLDAPPFSASVMDPRVVAKQQLRTSSCVGQGTSQGLRLGRLKAGEDCPELSARFIYRAALTAEHATTDDGTHIRSAIKVVQTLGCATEAAFPFSEQDILAPITLAAAHDAADRYGLRGYYRIYASDVVGVKRAIAAGYPVVAGWTVTQAFEDWRGGDPIGVLTDPVLGGHCMCIVAYAGDVFDLLNSWGIGWGRNGHALVTSDFVATAFDMWALDVREAS